ncbi:putative P450 monooxygenase [Bipolaris maydis]|nr:putative P450 monooxygenase [Bipolaris maydis]
MEQSTHIDDLIQLERKISVQNLAATNLGGSNNFLNVMRLTSALKSTIIYATLIFVLYYGILAIYNIYFHPLRKFPGPKLRAASDWPYVVSLLRGTSPQDMLEMHKKYGRVVRVAPNELTFVSPAAWTEIYGQKRRGQEELVKDKKYYSGMGEPTLLHSNQEQHAHLRKLLAHGFSNSSLQKQEAVIQKYLDVLMNTLKHQCQDGQVALDLKDWVNFFVFDVIAYLTYGQSFNCLETRNVHSWIELVPKLAKFMALMQAAQRLPIFIKPLFLLYGISTNLRSNEKVDYRLNSRPMVPDFMEKLIEEYKDGRMTMYQLDSNASFLMAAGSETLATVLTHAVFRLLTNPGTLEKLTTEIRTKFTCAADITMSSVNECKYLLGCIEETMRIQAPSPATHPRYTNDTGAVIDGFQVPGNVAVGIPIYAACRSALNFYDAESFIPERWTGEDPLYNHDLREAARVFSLGPRDCLGRNLAYAELKLVIARLVWHFDFEVCFEANWSDQKVYMVWEKPPFMVKMAPVQASWAT